MHWESPHIMANESLIFLSQPKFPSTRAGLPSHFNPKTKLQHKHQVRGHRSREANARSKDHHGLSLSQRPKNSIKTCLRKSLLVIGLHNWIKPLSCNMGSFFNWRKEKMEVASGRREWMKKKKIWKGQSRNFTDNSREIWGFWYLFRGKVVNSLWDAKKKKVPNSDFNNNLRVK